MRATPSTSPFFAVPAADERQRRRLHHDPAAGARDAPGDVLAADVDHVRLTGRVEMGKMGGLPAAGAVAAGRAAVRAAFAEVPVALPRRAPRRASFA